MARVRQEQIKAGEREREREREKGEGERMFIYFNGFCHQFGETNG